MWATLRSDLKEFVHTVTDESSHVLEAIDSKMQEAEDAATEADKGVEEEAVYTEDGHVVQTESDFEATGVVSNAADERLRRMSDEETFLEPLDDDNDFMESFDLDSKTEEIAQLLEEHDDTLKVMFEELVPTRVTYEEFWQRFYYRCDEDRIVSEWALEEERAREARAKALQGGIESVKNLWGGAVQAVSSTFEKTEEEENELELNASQPAETGISAALFGTGGRPPFVMNTAVDEDDDEEEEEEEEEELGWDDDDDDDDYEDEEDEEDDYVEGDSEEQIEFGASLKEEMEQLRQELAQAIEERDQLHQTVEMQSKAIAEFQLQEGNNAQPPTSDVSEEFEKLKITLFEKDAELAALKASLEDTHEDDTHESAKKDAAKVASQERELERLMQELSAKKDEVVQVEEQLKTASTEMEELRSQSQADNAVLDQLRSQSQADKTALFETQAAKSELESRLASLQEALAESESQRTAVESSMGDSASQVAAAEQEAAAAQTTIASLKAELEEVKGNLEFTTRRADHLDQELASVRKEMEQKEKEPSSPVSSDASGVKVPALDTHADGAVAAVEENDDEEEEGWGDDWGSDED